MFTQRLMASDHHWGIPLSLACMEHSRAVERCACRCGLLLEQRRCQCLFGWAFPSFSWAAAL